MVIRTTCERETGFSVFIDDQTVYHNRDNPETTSIPERFIINIPSNESFVLARLALTFLSTAKYVVSDLTGTEIASIEKRQIFFGQYRGTILTVATQSYRVKAGFKPRNWLSRGASQLSIQELDVHCKLRGKYWDCQAKSELQNPDQRTLAVTMLLQYFGVIMWRES